MYSFRGSATREDSVTSLINYNTVMVIARNKTKVGQYKNSTNDNVLPLNQQREPSVP